MATALKIVTARTKKWPRPKTWRRERPLIFLEMMGSGDRVYAGPRISIAICDVTGKTRRAWKLTKFVGPFKY